MPAISITDDQRERLRWIQARLEDDVEYGHVRPRDALEFLLDRFDEAGDRSPATGTDPEETASEAASESDSETDSASTTTSADATGRSGGFVVMNGGDVATSGGAAGRGDGDADTNDDAVETAEDAAGDEGAATSDSSETDGDETGGETRLNAVMSLLDDHDGKWRETGSGEEKYEVDLPDGGTERARTKDDVRAVLFRHYR